MTFWFSYPVVLNSKFFVNDVQQVGVKMLNELRFCAVQQVSVLKAGFVGCL